MALDDYRPSAVAGGINIAIAETVQATVTDGVLNIDFIQGTQNPAVKGFDICYVGPLPNTPPQFVQFISPEDGLVLRDCEADGELVNLNASFTDTEDDATATPLSIEWFNGTTSLGTGNPLNSISLSIGTHDITAVATDSGGESTTSSVTTVEVIPAPEFTSYVDTVGGSPLLNATIDGPDITVCWDVANLDFGGNTGEHFHLRLDNSDNGQGTGGVADGEPYVRIDVDNNTSGCFTFTNVAPGPHEISFFGAESGHNQICSKTIVPITVEDNVVPIITLNGDATINLTVGDTYTEQGATADDSYADGDITGAIVVGGDVVDPNTVGQYIVTYNVDDAAGNPAAEVTRTVNVSAAPDTTPPTIVLLGDNPLELTVGDTYTDPGATASDDTDGDISANIVVGGDVVNPNTVGQYIVTYNVDDAAGNPAAEVTRTVNVSAAPDTTPPTIVLLGDNPLELTVGDTYTDPGATASDDTDGNITGNIVVGGDVVDPNTVGQYIVTYNVDDAAGNPAAEVTRTVNVSAAPDTTPPTIVLLGDNPLELTVGDTYTDPGATASDDTDGDISANIVVGGDVVDPNTVGQYIVTYNVDDAAGNPATTVTRTVNVSAAPDTTPPTIVLLGDNPLELTVGDTYTDPGATASDDTDGNITGNIVVGGDVVDPNTVGQYIVTYNVDDAAGNPATTVTRTVNVSAAPDTTPPTIVLLGDNPLELTVGDTYTDPGATASDDTDGNITGNIVVGGDVVDPNTVGQYIVTYNVDDAAGNPAAEVTRTVNVSAAPVNDVFFVVNPATSTHTVNDTFSVVIEVQANDQQVDLAEIHLTFDPSIVEVISLTPGTTLPVELVPPVFDNAVGTIDYSAGIFSNFPSGTFDLLSIEFSAIGSGNTTLAFIDPAGAPSTIATFGGGTVLTGTTDGQIVIEALPDNTPPVISLLGDNPLELFVGDIYNEPGATATDDVDGNISANIVIGGDVVDPNAVGQYIVTYNVSDAAGNPATEVTRVVNVSIAPDTTSPAITLLGDNPLELTVGDTYTDPGATASDDTDGDISANIVVGGDVVDPNTVGQYIVTYNVSDQAGNPATQVTRTVNVNTPPVANASVKVNPNGNLTASTFGNNSFQIENTGDIDITSVSFDLSTAFMGDIVFDPIGTAGDDVGKCLTTGNGGNTAAEVGITVPADGGSDIQDCESIFSNPHNNIDVAEGYDSMTLNFTDFNAGENYFFGVDIDPTSIKDQPGSGDAGAVSGFELIGAMVTITFADGSILTNSLFDEGSLGGSQALLPEVSTAPMIEVVGVLNTPAEVFDLNQTIKVTGAPNESITLLQVDAQLQLGTGNPGYDIDAFEANTAVAKSLYTVVLDANGEANIPVILLQTNIDSGINHFIAAIVNEDGSTSKTSNTIKLIVGDDTPPEITLLGDNPLELTEGDTYTDPGATALDDKDGDITANIVVGGDVVDTSVPGSYIVTYNVSDTAGNPATEVTRTVNVSPAPVILTILSFNLIDADNDVIIQQLNEGDVINLANLVTSNLNIEAVATEDTGSVTLSLSGDATAGKTENVAPFSLFGDTNGDFAGMSFNPGNYAIAATAFSETNAGGNSGNENTVNFSLIFDTGPDNVPPIITLLGDNPLEVIIGDAYNEPGATANDNVDGDISGSIAIDASAVDTNTLGSYDVTYNVNDAAGNPATEVIRTVQVIPVPDSIAILNTDAVSPEGNQGTTQFIFTALRGGDTSAPTSVDYEVVPIESDADDFGGALPSGTLNFAADQLTQVLIIDVSGDTQLEADESFQVVLSNPLNGEVLDPNFAVGIIENDDAGVGPDNGPDENTNLALLEEAVLSGSVNGGRGGLQHILYDPMQDDYFVATQWNEYGVGYLENLGTPGPEDGFEWRVDWPTPKLINYVTFGGTYPNQPQPNSMWRISYLNGGSWVTLDEGQGGWIDSGIFEWDNTGGAPITADALRVRVYSDGSNNLVSIHLRGRGGTSFGINDSGTATKATLVQYLPAAGTAPTADFSFTANALDVNFDGTLSSDDVGISDYSWDFGDGSTDNGANVSHTYGASGIYTVTLTVTDGDGLTDSISRQVEVDDGLVAPTADFSFTANVLDVDFDGTLSSDDVGISDYSWDFGDGNTDNGANVSHTYGTSGVYTVVLTVTDGDGLTDSASRTVIVTDGTADNGPDENTNLALLEEAVLSGSVNGGRGGLQHILYDPMQDDYFVATQWNEYGVGYLENLGTPGPEDGFEWRVDWPTPKLINYVTFGGTYPNQPQPNSMWRISYLNGGSWVTLDEGQGGWIDSGIFEWDNTGGAPITADALRVRVYSDGSNNLVSIHLRGRGGTSFGINDSGTATKATLVQYLPAAGTAPTADFSFTANALDVNFDGTLSSDDVGISDYSWDFGDGSTDNGANVSHTYGASGIYTVTLTVTDGDGLTDSISRQVEVDDGLVAPTADFSFTANVLDVDFDGTLSSDDVGISDYSWDFGDGNTDNGANVSHTYGTSGVYTVVLTVTDGDGLTDSASRTVIVTDGTADNNPDENTNLALLEEAVLSGSVNGGRGGLQHILYDPMQDDYFVATQWNEYGVGYLENLGTPGPEDGFEWRVDWPTPKLINYVTFGGTYPNQPQPNSMWRISYLNNGSWVTLDEGQGGWVDSGIFEWDNTGGAPITADALRVRVYSDGSNNLVSIHLRGRGGTSFGINDSGTATKATLVQYLPSASQSQNTILAGREFVPNQLTVHPNPAADYVNMSFDIPTEVVEFRVFDITGRLVRVEKVDTSNNEYVIPVFDLPAGAYFIKTIDDKGTEFQEHMIIEK